jgi:acetyl esterase/lipase
MERSVLHRRARPPDHVEHYGSGRQVVDVWPAETDTAAPLVILVHGGFWRDDYDRRHLRPAAVALARAGFTVAAPEYRRSKRTTPGWPATFSDIAEAIDRIPPLLEGLDRIDVTRIVLAGHSAGGHLALWAAALDRLPPDTVWYRDTMSPIAAVLALAPVAHLRAAHRDGLGGGAVSRLLGGSPQDVPDRYNLCDPILRAPRIPTIILHGECDAVVPIRLSRDMADLHPTMELRALAGVDHFDLIDPLSGAWQNVTEALAELATTPLASSPSGHANPSPGRAYTLHDPSGAIPP